MSRPPGSCCVRSAKSDSHPRRWSLTEPAVPALDPTLSLIITLGTALLFGAAAGHKLADWRRFRAALGNYRLLPDPLVPAVAAAVAALEIAACILLLLPALREAGAVLAAGLLALYAIAIGINLARG